MAQPSFDIGPDRETFENCCLLMEVSDRFFNYIVYDNDSKSLCRIRQYIIEPLVDKGLHNILEEIIDADPLLAKPVKETTILYNFAESSMFPEKHFDTALNESLIELVYGDVNKGAVLNENVRGWDMFNIYRVPKATHAFFQQRFPASRYWHFYTQLLLSVKSEGQRGNLVKAIFYNDKFVAAFFSGDKLQVIQSFIYQTPEDTAYHLLLMCRQFGIRPEDVILMISGLIDEQSALYSELFKYFAKVEYEGIPGIIKDNGMLDEYPSYYFSPLLKLSLCV